MIRRPPRSTLSSSSAASDVYKRQIRTRPFALTPTATANMSALPETMIALKSTVREDQTLQLGLFQTPLPELQPGQVLVRVEAAPINPSDLSLLLARSDVSQATAAQTEAGLTSVEAPIPDAAFGGQVARVGKSMSAGNEGAGVVVGPADSPLLGRAVGVVGGEMYAQYKAVSADMLLPLPEGVPAKAAASWFVNPLTALGMVEYMRLDGHTAIVHTAAASQLGQMLVKHCVNAVSYTHLRAHETVLDLVCRLLLEKKKKNKKRTKR
eukprot:TRINITY_DN10231_c0_g1_i3.p1 TRINITY_DN10231_c0_g1~~TRINITY_DN10231_c0_g1_i3.p1  ORF type:complete len:267 (+),score=51.61 TRINITY_DN10231_c0_g1_i3:82-882(+)